MEQRGLRGISAHPLKFKSLLAALLGIFILPVLAIKADEPAQEFLDALRARGYYDLALEYLETLKTSDLVDSSFKDRIPLEKAQTLIDSVNSIRDLEKWESRLSEAQTLLTNYSKAAKDTESISTAKFAQADLSYRQAKVYLMRSESDRLTESEKQTQLGKAREYFNKSLNGFLQARDLLKEVLANFEFDAANAKESARKRDKLRRDFLTAKLRIPLVRESVADTFTDEKKKKEQLTEAATEYSELWDKYYKYPQGLDSCLYAARVNFKLENYKEAIVFAEEIFSLPSSSDFRVIKRKAAVIAMDSWRKMDPYPYEIVIEMMTPMVEALNRNDKANADWLQVQLELARAYRTKAEDVKKNDGKPSEVSRLNKQAAILARAVSRYASPVREEARTLLTEWKIDVNAPIEETNTVATFDDAKNQARDLASELETLSIEYSRAKQRLAANANPAEASKLQAEFDNASEQLFNQADITLAMLQKSLVLSDDSTNRNDINFVRYLQCYCYYVSDRHFESVIIGEFLLNRYPAVGWSQQAAGLTIKSYLRMMASTPENERASQQERLSKVCTETINRWSGSKDAILGAKTMAELSLEAQDYDKAQEYFATIPSEATERADLALKVGQKLWFSYRSDKEKDADKLNTAISMLQEGVDGSNKEKLSFTAALGSLLLVEAYLASDQVDKAVERLETAKIAPLDLIKQKNPAVTNAKGRDLFVRETYKTSIKTFLRAMENGNEEKWIAKAQGVLQALKNELPDTPDGKQKLTAIYKVIAAQLTTQFDSISQPAKKAKIASDLGQFFESIAENTTDGMTAVWAGQTLLGIADRIEGNETSRPLYGSCQTILERASKIGFQGEENVKDIQTEVKRMKGLSKRGLGQFEDAMTLLTEVLNGKPNHLVAQLDAADTLQMWGKSASLSNAYAEAMQGKGQYKDPKTNRSRKLIWGWRKLIELTRKNDSLKDVYFRSYYGQIESMFEYGKLTDNEKALSSAKKEMSNVKLRDPELGGAKWKSKFEELEKRINAN